MSMRQIARLATTLSLSSMLLAGCGLMHASQPEQPPHATGSPDDAIESQLPDPPNGTISTTRPSEASPTSAADDLKTYIAQEAGFAIQYPADDELFVGARPSADGVLAPVPHSITIVHPPPPNFQLSIEYSARAEASSLAEFIAEDDCDMGDAIGEEILVAGKLGLLFPDTPCGPYGSSRLYLIHEGSGYRFVVETHENYATVRDLVLSLLSTVRWLDAGT